MGRSTKLYSLSPIFALIFSYHVVALVHVVQFTFQQKRNENKNRGTELASQMAKPLLFIQPRDLHHNSQPQLHIYSHLHCFHFNHLHVKYIYAGRGV